MDLSQFFFLLVKFLPFILSYFIFLGFSLLLFTFCTTATPHWFFCFSLVFFPFLNVFKILSPHFFTVDSTHSVLFSLLLCLVVLPASWPCWRYFAASIIFMILPYFQQQMDLECQILGFVFFSVAYFCLIRVYFDPWEWKILSWMTFPPPFFKTFMEFLALYLFPGGIPWGFNASLSNCNGKR